MTSREKHQVFISYARSTEGDARRVADMLKSCGYVVWWDQDLPAHRAYGEVIEERLTEAKAVVVIWSADAIKSQWVRAEADAARHSGKLVQLSIDGAMPPMPFNQIQCPVFLDWADDFEAPAWRIVESSVGELVTGERRPEVAAVTTRGAKRPAICVLPFINLSGDKEQEYFGDGITEDLITDLSKITQLDVVARNLSFSLKDRPVEVRALARQFNITHILEGSVRKAGRRLRITAQLIDAATGLHLWADRYDRELADIFDIQDEISKAIIGQLRIKLLPAERKVLEHRGTLSAEAYDLYLLARRQWISGNDGTATREETIIRICERAVAIDPAYAHAWALMAMAQSHLQFRQKDTKVDGLASAERALHLDPNLAEAHAVKARYLLEAGDHIAAEREVKVALRLDPESWEVNKVAAKLWFARGQLELAATCYGKAADLMELDHHSACMLMTCCRGLGDGPGTIHAAELTLARAQKALQNDPGNGSPLGHGVNALAALGDTKTAKEWVERALVVDPDNLILRYNLVCALATDLKDPDRALELLERTLGTLGSEHVRHVQADPDMASIRDHARFQEMLAGAKARLGHGQNAASTSIVPRTGLETPSRTHDD